MKIGMLAFPSMTVLDLVGPYEVFNRLREARIEIIAQEPGLVDALGGLRLVVDRTFDGPADFDVFFVPGGPGIDAVLQDDASIDFVRRAGSSSRWVSSACTGSVILAAAGLLEGYRATTHWRFYQLLERLGAIPVQERVVVDRNRITGAGVTAGIEMALRLAEIIDGPAAARMSELWIEYDPEKVFEGGHPRSAAPDILQNALQLTEDALQIRLKLVERFANK